MKKLNIAWNTLLWISVFASGLQVFFSTPVIKILNNFLKVGTSYLTVIILISLVIHFAIEEVKEEKRMKVTTRQIVLIVIFVLLPIIIMILSVNNGEYDLPLIISLLYCCFFSSFYNEETVFGATLGVALIIFICAFLFGVILNLLFSNFTQFEKGKDAGTVEKVFSSYTIEWCEDADSSDYSIEKSIIKDALKKTYHIDTPKVVIWYENEILYSYFKYEGCWYRVHDDFTEDHSLGEIIEEW